jgi:hypothetical protein
MKCAKTRFDNFKQITITKRFFSLKPFIEKKNNPTNSNSIFELFKKVHFKEKVFIFLKLKIFCVIAKD